MKLLSQFLDADLIPLLFTSFAQAFISSSVSLAIGALGAFGLVQLSRSLRRPTELFLLLPQILPSLFILMSAYNLYSWFSDVPSGFSAVIIVHSAINCGFCAVVLSRLYSEKAGSFSELARVEGASLITFLPALVQLLFRDLVFVFFTVFVFCFTSFSIPFVLGGYGSATVEVEIYEKIIAQGALSEALILSSIQIVFLMVMGVYLYGRGYSLGQKAKRAFIYGHWVALLPLLVLNALIVFGSLRGVAHGWQNLKSQDILQKVAIHATMGTLLTSFVAGLATIFIVSLIVYRWPQKDLSLFFLVLLARAPFYLASCFSFLRFIKYMAPPALFFLVFYWRFFTPLIFRFGLASEFSRYDRQVEVAKTLGASHGLIFRQVLWPQLAKPLFFFSGIVAFWAAGDFALSLFILPGEAHLPLLVRGLISRYRLDVATLLMWWMIVIGFMQLILFQGLGYVFSRKSA